jgi:NADPH:quinone reductase-like Zn-dependent oxidoreductase
MKAVVRSEYGPAELLHIEEIPSRAPSQGEVLIRVRAAEVTKSDCELRGFKFSVSWFWLPLRLFAGIFKPRNQVLGGYFSGVVEALGEGVDRFEVGDEVYGSAGISMGAYGAYLVTSANNAIVRKPTNLSFEEAAAVPLGGLNALHFMRVAKIRPGDEVLVNGAGGSIGIFAVQIAKSMGARVTAVDSEKKEEMLRKIGADHFVNYAARDFTRDTERYDVLFDMVPGSSYSRCLSVLKPGGRYLLGNPRLLKILRSFFTNWFSDILVSFAFAGEQEEELLALSSLLEAGEIHSVVDRIYPPGEAAEAHRLVESEQRTGCVVLSMPESWGTETAALTV